MRRRRPVLCVLSVVAGGFLGCVGIVLPVAEVVGFRPVGTSVPYIWFLLLVLTGAVLLAVAAAGRRAKLCAVISAAAIVMGLLVWQGIHYAYRWERWLIWTLCVCSLTVLFPIVIIFFVVAAIKSFAEIFRPVSSSPGICVECGYDLRSLTEPRCPECGTPFDLHPQRDGDKIPKTRARCS